MTEEMILVIFVFLIIVAPILGITARIAIKPIVEAIIRLRESFSDSSGGPLMERRIGELEAELREVRNEVERLVEAEAFHRKLLEPGSHPAALDDPER